MFEDLEKLLNVLKMFKEQDNIYIDEIIILKTRKAYKDYIDFLEFNNFKWLDGSKPTEYCPFNEYDDDFKTVYLLINTKNRYILYDFNKPIKSNSISNIENAEWYEIIDDRKINLKNKKPFEELKCGDFNADCIGCPFHRIDCRVFNDDESKSFGKTFEEIKNVYEEAKNNYKKGD